MSLISFLTTFPSGCMSLENAAKRSYLFPLIGLFIGLVVGLVSKLFFHLTNPILASILTLIVLYFVVGINHIDGLADFSDGIYVIGNRGKKFEVMKGTQLGVAGFLVLFFFLLLSLYCYYQLSGLVSGIVVAEVSAKTGMQTSIFLGKSRKIGIGSVFIKNIRRDLFPVSVLFSMIVCFYLAGFRGFIALLGALTASFIIVKIAHKDLGCVTGDVCGAVNELSRLTALLVIIK